MQSLPDGVAILNDAFQIKQINKAFQSLAGFKYHSHTDQTILDLIQDQELLRNISHGLGQAAHGIETKEEFDVERLADALGHTVWTAILNSLFGGAELPELEVLRANRFFDQYELLSQVRGTVKTDPDPEIDAIALVEVEIIQESEVVPPPSSD